MQIPKPCSVTHARSSVLFFAEMWERFSFYGMRALLIFYLTQHLSVRRRRRRGHLCELRRAGVPDAVDRRHDRGSVSRVSAKPSYSAPCCCASATSAWRLKARRRVRPRPAIERDPVALQTFYASLAFIIIGVGFLKPSISSIVGGLYAKNDPRRDGGFTIFYMGINLGAMLASLIVGYLGQTLRLGVRIWPCRARHARRAWSRSCAGNTCSRRPDDRAIRVGWRRSSSRG